MGLKKKIFGFAAAAAFTVSMMGGAVSAESFIGTAQLNPSECAMTVSASGNFGTWEFDGTQGYAPNSNTVMTLETQVTKVPSLNSKCVINTTATGLALNGQGTILIPVENFSYEAPGGVSGTGVLPTSQPVGITVPFDVDIKLDDVPNSLAPGTYKGTLTYTISPQ